MDKELKIYEMYTFDDLKTIYDSLKFTLNIMSSFKEQYSQDTGCPIEDVNILIDSVENIICKTTNILNKEDCQYEKNF